MLRTTAEGVKALGKIDLVNQLMDVQLEMMKLLQEHQQLFDANRELQRTIAELAEKLKFQAALKFEPPFYYADGDKTPFCPQCWEADRKPIHLHGPFVRSAKHNYWWECHTCKRDFDSRKSLAGRS